MSLPCPLLDGTIWGMGAVTKEPEFIPGAHEAGVPVWRHERQSRLRVPPPLYRSNYLNTFLSGRLEDGREVALVAGAHSRYFPYHNPRSGFDDVLLVVGSETLRVSGRHISSLGISLGPRDSASVFYNGRAYARSGAAIQLDFHFNLFARVHAARPQGVGIPHLMLGLLWQPALVVGSGTITIHDDRFRVVNVVGEMERGTLTNVRSRFFQFGYEYFATARTGGAPVAYVTFRTYELHPGLAGLIVRAMQRIHPSRESVTMSGDRLVEGDPNEVNPGGLEKLEPVVGHTINLGPASISRGIVRVGQGDSARYAFHERVTREG